MRPYDMWKAQGLREAILIPPSSDLETLSWAFLVPPGMFVLVIGVGIGLASKDTAIVAGALGLLGLLTGCFLLIRSRVRKPSIIFRADGVEFKATGFSAKWAEIIGAYCGQEPKGCGILGAFLHTLSIVAVLLGGGVPIGFKREEGVVVVVTGRRRTALCHSKKAISTALASLPPSHRANQHAKADYVFVPLGSLDGITAAELAEMINAHAEAPRPG